MNTMGDDGPESCGCLERSSLSSRLLSCLSAVSPG
jgi:hypothetical protein